MINNLAGFAEKDYTSDEWDGILSDVEKDYDYEGFKEVDEYETSDSSDNDSLDFFDLIPEQDPYVPDNNKTLISAMDEEEPADLDNIYDFYFKEKEATDSLATSDDVEEDDLTHEDNNLESYESAQEDTSFFLPQTTPVEETQPTLPSGDYYHELGALGERVGSIYESVSGNRQAFDSLHSSMGDVTSNMREMHSHLVEQSSRLDGIEPRVSSISKGVDDISSKLDKSLENNSTVASHIYEKVDSGTDLYLSGLQGVSTSLDQVTDKISTGNKELSQLLHESGISLEGRVDKIDESMKESHKHLEAVYVKGVNKLAKFNVTHFEETNNKIDKTTKEISEALATFDKLKENISSSSASISANMGEFEKRVARGIEENNKRVVDLREDINANLKNLTATHKLSDQTLGNIEDNMKLNFDKIVRSIETQTETYSKLLDSIHTISRRLDSLEKEKSSPIKSVENIPRQPQTSLSLSDLQRKLGR